MRIAVLSLADINNYGDAFFPLVLKAELLKRVPDAEIELITNTEYDCGLYCTTAYSKEYLSGFDAVILGGGELISPYDDESFLATYADCGYQGVPSDIAHGWLDLEKPFKAWFSVGAHPVLYDYPSHVDIALSSLDYLCVRGTISKKVLERYLHINDGSIKVIPDLGWLFSRYIDEYVSTANIISDEARGQEYIAFEAIDDLDIDANAAMIAETLVSFQESTGVKAVLTPIIITKNQWSEMAALEKIYNASEGLLTLLPQSSNVLDAGAALRNAKFFVGSSLHGAVTLLSYGKPAVNIRSGINTKLQDLHAARFRSTCFANGWDVLPGVLERLNNEADNEIDRKYALMYAEYMRYRLDREIDNLAASIKRHVSV